MRDRVPLLRSPMVPAPFVHGFSTRAGGVSGAAYASLNLGAKWGDDPARVRENRRRFLRAASIGQLLSLTQVHGADVVIIDAERAAEPEAVARSRGDALACDLSGIALGIYSADCIPILLADPETGAFAAAHAGWRGTVAGVAAAVVRALVQRYRTNPAHLRVALGPSIGPCCFEVGEEVAARFQAPFVRPGASRNGRPTVDLRAANQAVLVSAGVPAHQIDALPACTACDPARFYSFRRDGRETGQHVAFITRQP
ncbi:MAG TPA: peptidoglycan editing factor PgeF [Polyangia bacterium]|nr:peptidoglycan editing factor PgeF [Polyangia bacterium]